MERDLSDRFEDIVLMDTFDCLAHDHFTSRVRVSLAGNLIGIVCGMFPGIAGESRPLCHRLRSTPGRESEGVSSTGDRRTGDPPDSLIKF